MQVRVSVRASTGVGVGVGVGVSDSVIVSVKVVDERVRMGLRVRVGMKSSRHAVSSLPRHCASRRHPAARRAAARRLAPIAPPPITPRPAPSRSEKKIPRVDAPCLPARSRRACGSQDVNMARVEGGQARASWVKAHLGTLSNSLPSSLVNSRMM